MGGLGVNTHTLRKRAVHPQRTSKAAANFSLFFFEKIDRLSCFTFSSGHSLFNRTRNFLFYFLFFL